MVRGFLRSCLTIGSDLEVNHLGPVGDEHCSVPRHRRSQRRLPRVPELRQQLRLQLIRRYQLLTYVDPDGRRLLKTGRCVNHTQRRRDLQLGITSRESRLGAFPDQ